jgi:hypothetical protein
VTAQPDAAGSESSRSMANSNGFTNDMSNTTTTNVNNNNNNNNNTTSSSGHGSMAAESEGLSAIVRSGQGLLLVYFLLEHMRAMHEQSPERAQRLVNQLLRRLHRMQVSFFFFFFFFFLRMWLLA